MKYMKHAEMLEKLKVMEDLSKGMKFSWVQKN
jgi:hypothetical protein